MIPFVVVDGAGPVIATAIHNGHDLRAEVASQLSLDAATRLREEDPHTDRLAAVVTPRVVVNRSRFEVDLNRPRSEAIYTSPDQSWGLEVWKQEPSQELVDRSLAVYDEFYQAMAQLFDRVAASGPFAVLDLHSYNHRRAGRAHPPAPTAENPDVNVGTGWVDRSRWRSLVDKFCADLKSRLPEALVGENVRFRGGHFSRWINERYAGTGCALAIEFKKTFMDEWTGELDAHAVDRLAEALAGAVPGLTRELESQ